MEPDARPAERWKPAELGVHPATGGGPHGSMPAYIRRPHDEVLRSMLDPGVPGSRLIVVRGEVCAGKSRAAYVAVADRLTYHDPDPACGGVIDVPSRFTAGELTAAAARGDPVLAGPPAAGDVASRGTDALAWASAELDGAVRALDPVRSAADAGLAGYRIAGYLDQHGRRTRQGQLGPASLWDALTARPAGSGAGDLTRVAQAARDRGLYRHAAAGWTAAVSAGSADAAGRLVAHLRGVSPEDAALAARWAVGRVRLDDPWDLARLLDELRAAGAGDALRALLATRAATGARLEDPAGVARLLEELRTAGAGDAVRALLARDPAGQVSLGPDQQPGVGRLLATLRAAGASEAAGALAARAADAGMFDLATDRARYPFGREPDGAPAPPWHWAELLPDPGAAGAPPAR